MQQLAWPVRTTLVRHAYLVSDLQQRTAKATASDLVRANFVRRELLEAVKDGEALTFKPMPEFKPDDVAVIAVHDASFSSETAMIFQQG